MLQATCLPINESVAEEPEMLENVRVPMKLSISGSLPELGIQLPRYAISGSESSTVMESDV